MSQCDRVSNYIREFGRITSLQAMSDLGVMRLASRVNDLKRVGLPIRSRMVSGKNRYAEATSYAEYYFEEGNND